MLVKHRKGLSSCEYLRTQAAMLDTLEMHRDEKAMQRESLSQQSPVHGAEPSGTPGRSEEYDYEYLHQRVDEILEEDELEDDEDDDLNFEQLSRTKSSGTGTRANEAALPAEATPDVQGAIREEIEDKNESLHPVVRVVHTTGIHHIVLVTCECRGHADVCLDLMYHRLVVTTFVRHRTLFTADVLDYFRLLNLELHVSAV